MILHKCKICGGDLIPVPGSVIATCENRGTEQPFPWGEDPRKLKLFAHANRLRLACEFDKAAGIYEAIIADYPEEAEAYWGLVLCKYGIEYVTDPKTGRKTPTCQVLILQPSLPEATAALPWVLTEHWFMRHHSAAEIFPYGMTYMSLESKESGGKNHGENSRYPIRRR